MNPDNLKLILGIAAAALAIFAPTIWEKIKPFFPKKNPSKGPSARKGKPAEVDEDTDLEEINLQYLEFYSIHDIIEYLIEDRKKAKDKEGILLAGSFGSHIYNKMLEGVK